MENNSTGGSESGKTLGDVPVLTVMCSSFPCSISAGEAFGQFGGTEGHDGDGTRFWTFDSPETPQELLQSCITERKGEDYALAWFDFLDGRIEDMKDGDDLDGFFSRYAEGHDDKDAYKVIERDWVRDNGLDDHLKGFMSGDMSGIPDMADADEDEWRDAFILNLPHTLPDMMSKHDADALLGPAQDLIDDLALIHMGIGIYAGTRKYDTIRAYAE